MWLQNGNTFATRDPGNDLPKLPPFVYTIQVTMMGMFLEKQQDAFEFPYKLYGASDFPARVAHNYTETNGNLGVLMTGLKGTGKTVEAELICNHLKLPVILVDRNFDGLVPFLNRIPEDVVIFIDEYEKIFERSNALLSLMDGALRTKHRRIFILTTNETYISDAMFKALMNIRQRRQAMLSVYHTVGDKRHLISHNATIDPPWPFSADYLPKPDEDDIDDRKGYQVNIMEGNDDNGRWKEYGNLLTVDAVGGKFTTTQGEFIVVQSNMHPSLIRYMAA